MIRNLCLDWYLQFALLETSSVDDDLADLKKELSGSTKVKLFPRNCNHNHDHDHMYCIESVYILIEAEGRASTGETGCSSVEVSRPRNREGAE